MTYPIPKTSPWGRVQYGKEIFPGLISVGTAGHGGIFVVPAVRKLLPDYFKKAAFNNNGAWYEEDCDWAIPVTWALHDAVRDEKQDGLYQEAVKSLKTWNPDIYEKFFGVVIPPGESLIKDERQFYVDHADHLVVISAIGVDDGLVKATATIGGKRQLWQGPAVSEHVFLIPQQEYQERGRFGFVIADPSKYQEVTA